MGSKANIVLVHGAWADGSSWSQVIPLLQQKEFNVTAAQIPLTSLADDIAVTRNLLAAQKGPTIPRMEPSAVLTSFAKALSPFRQRLRVLPFVAAHPLSRLINFRPGPRIEARHGKTNGEAATYQPSVTSLR
jgi:hypothetical protein